MHFLKTASKKIERLRLTLSHHEADRVPVGEFFWTGFIKQCCAKWGSDFDPYRFFDMDYVVITPNMDPHIQPFRVVEDNGDLLISTGFGATIRRRTDLPMPHYDKFCINSPEDMAKFKFENANDPRRFSERGDDQINCVGDALIRNIEPWQQRVASYVNDFAIFGSVCEPFEYLWRIIGSENALLWMGIYPELLQAFIERIGEFLVSFVEAQIKAGEGKLSGMYIWGDVAYVNGMLFGAPRWRKLFKPHVKRLINLCHANNLMVIYHGCGNASEIYNDMVEIGLDAYNPLESKAGLDVVKLKKSYTGKLAFEGNIDVRVLERGNAGEIKNEILYKLQAAKGGGWIFHSDHSVSSDVTPDNYALAINLLRQYGSYPLNI